MSGASLDRVVIPAIQIAVAAAVVAAFLTGNIPAPFPLVEFALLVSAAALLRRFGLPLPGKGFASFILLVPLFTFLHRGWGWAALVSVVGILVGDVVVRRLPIKVAAANGGLIGFAVVLVGVLYDRIGGVHGALALGSTNTLPLIFAAIVLPMIPNAFFYLQIYLSDAAGFVDPRLTLRWEAVVAVLDVALAFGWLGALATHAPVAIVVERTAALLGLTALAHYICRRGVRADELALLQRLARAIAADVNIERNFATIQRLTSSLIPWAEMGFSRYDQGQESMVVVLDTEPANVGVRVAAGGGPLGEALQRRRAVAIGAMARRGWTQDALRGQQGSQILVPLFQGDIPTGAWNLRHPDPLMYRHSDAAMLEGLAPQMALAVAVHSLVSPLVDSSVRTTAHVESVTATSQEIHASSQEVAAAAQRAEAGAERAASLTMKAEEAMVELRALAHDASQAGEETHRAAGEMERAAQAVRAATASTATSLERIGVTVSEGSAEVERLRRASEQVARFAETIGAIADQTNMLALNATIERRRAATRRRARHAPRPTPGACWTGPCDSWRRSAPNWTTWPAPRTSGSPNCRASCAPPRRPPTCRAGWSSSPAATPSAPPRCRPCFRRSGPRRRNPPRRPRSSPPRPASSSRRSKASPEGPSSCPPPPANWWRRPGSCGAPSRLDRDDPYSLGVARFREGREY
jgi:hypothetical protein